MHQQIIYIHQPEKNSLLDDLFFELYDNQKITTLSLDMLKIEIINPFEEPIDHEEIHALIQSDFELKISILAIEKEALNVLNEETLLNYFIKLPKKVYDIESFLISLIKRYPEMIPPLQKNLVKLLGYELIETTLAIAEANMNLSITAKKRYMHRNTLHYRIDKIIETTSIDIKTFKGLSVFTLIFKD
ncbi:helix-turn-helix domain-containing protein [Liberiplasma polymorphum]|jgi:hypothetical protein|uniref:helix-turn-helix domain-containing protein n=1 Tax=Liberiplasma polymorphum TaxID=3374570 RepID=UPI0037741B3D